MQMADHDMVDAIELAAVFQELELGSFAAVNQKKILFNLKQLGGRKPAKGRCCRAAA